MKDLKDRLRILLCNPQPHGVEELAEILSDLLDRLDGLQCNHEVWYTDGDGVERCSLCGEVRDKLPRPKV